MNLEDREEMEALAGEYVLGVLSIDEAAEIERALPGNPELRRAVYYWENRLLNLTALAAPMEPETDLWQRIERDLPRKAPLHSQAAHVDSRQPGIWRSLSFWRFTSLA
ncbi:MAG: RNA polymerase subunit sigma-70, partial [Pseudomonadota bacterium]|nr:RNA polymerase subunit sigma-70 [Pseudomonadota bacterium]